MKLRHEFPVIVVVGIPGVGKSTILSIATKKLEEQGFQVLVLNYGDYMFKALNSKGIVKNRDEIRKLDLRTQLEHQSLAAQMLIDDARKSLGAKGILIVDTHAVIRTSTGYWPGLPQHVIEILKPDVIAVIEAPVSDIVARQRRDKTRYRLDLAREDIVREMLEMTRYFAIASATLVGASVVFIMNLEGRAEEAAENLVGVIRSIL